MRATTGTDALLGLCDDLRRIRQEADGPSVRTLAARVGLGKSQISAILNGRISRTPDWDVVRGMVAAIYEHAAEHRRLVRLSILAGLDEYWRLRHAMVEHACGRKRARITRDT